MNYSGGKNNIQSSRTKRQLLEILELNLDAALTSYCRITPVNEKKGPISIATLNSNIEAVKSSEKYNPNADTRNIIDRFYNEEMGDAPFYLELKKRLGKDLQDQSGVLEFCGVYNAYYASEASTIQQGNIKIIHTEQNIFIYESATRISRQEADGNAIHQGFVFIIGNHLYLTGLGSFFSRPIMIDVLNKEVKKDFLHGIVLSVTAESKRVFARRLFLHHTENKVHDFNTLDDAFIKEALRNRTAEPQVPMMLHVEH